MLKLAIRVIVLAGAILGFAYGTSVGISDYGNPAISRLWVATPDGDRFACTVSYIYPYISDSGSWVVSAGHCAEAVYLKRTANDWIVALVNWRGVLQGDPRYTAGYNDLAVGTAPDVRDGKHLKLWLAETMPAEGRAYIHGFPSGVEQVTVGEIVPAGSAAGVDRIAKDAPGTRLVLVPRRAIAGGSSGSPVLDQNGRLVGILWGYISQEALKAYFPGIDLGDWEIALVTPVERLHELMAVLGVKR